MPVPREITNQPDDFAAVWRGQLGVTAGPRGPNKGGQSRVLQKTFITYIEVFEQTAHDVGLHGYARQKGITPRRAHRGRVQPANNGLNALTYYVTHGQTAAQMVSEFITERWTETVTGNENVFVRNAKQTLTSQSVVQPNGFCYDVTMWYDNTDVYVAFHCYHP